MIGTSPARPPDGSYDGSHEGPDERPLGPALRRGLRGLCPNCGKAPILHRYLTVHDHCASCNEALHHHRADDGPTYVTVLIVSHVLGPVMLAYYMMAEPSPLFAVSVLSLAATTMTLLMLPRVKGAFVALQWAKRMHGFGGAGHG